METEKSLKKKRLIVIAILLFIVSAIVATDLFLFSTSLEEEGKGRGFSRYWIEGDN